MTFRSSGLPENNFIQIQHLLNKKTAKKQFLHPSIRFNSHQEKQNQYQRSNVVQLCTQFSQNLSGKETVRKHNDTTDFSREEQFCTNHPQKKAEYMVKIEDETLKYCRKCATQVASQGFEINKIVTSPIQNLAQGLMNSSTSALGISTESILLPSISPSRRRSSLSQRTSQNFSEKRSELHSLTSELKNIRIQYKQKVTQLTQICGTFKRQKQTLTQYYTELISHIQEIMDSHIQAIDETSVNVVQVCEIQKGQIAQTLEEINDMIQDVEGNFDSIIEHVDEKNYAQCYDFYRQKSGYFSHRLEELGSEAKPWPCTSQEEILSKTHSFKSFVNELHEVHEEDPSDENSLTSFTL